MNCIEVHDWYGKEYELWIVWNYMKFMVYEGKCMNDMIIMW